MAIDGSNRNSLWASILADELAKCGVRHAVLAPGSRLTPMTLALWQQPEITVHSVLDERAAAFFAQGIGKASGLPAVVVCTSGTAAANFYPAIIEANESGIPLIALTADYPEELRASGANQIIDQVGLYGRHVRWFADIANPYANPSDRSLRYLRSTVDRAVAHTRGPQRGPVHLNLPFDKPLEPVLVEGDVPGAVLDGLGAQGRDVEFTFIAEGGRPAASPEAISLLRQAIADSPRGLIVAGPMGDPDPELADWVMALSEAAGYPILADPLSPLRFGHSGQILGGHESFLRGELGASLKSELIIQVGGLPVSAALLDFLDSCTDSRRMILNDGPKWADRSYLASEWLPTSTLKALAEGDGFERQPDPAWSSLFAQVEQATWGAVDELVRSDFSEGSVAASLVEALLARANLFVSNSNPIRLIDQFVPPQEKAIRLFANRGVSGIDGVLASALGVAAASGQPTALLIGDLALLHDLNSLHLIRRLGIPLVVVVINNNGGGIFHRLPIAAYEPPFHELFQTPHGLSFAHAAELFDLPYTQAEGTAAFNEAIAGALESGQAHLIEVPSDPAVFEGQRRALIETVAKRTSEFVTMKSRG